MNVKNHGGTRMLAAQRRDVLLSRLATDGRLVAREDSISRDLRDLAAAGLCQGVYGGALPASPAVAGYAVRASVAMDSKQRGAQAAAAPVRPGTTVLLHGGATAPAGTPPP